MSLSPNIVTNKLSVQERWLKLYRKIHNLFIKDELVHMTDYLKTIAALNARITELETKITAEQVKLVSHAHQYIAPLIPAPGPPVPTLPAGASLPGYTAGSVVTVPVVHETTAMQAFDNLLQATGPAIAPLGSGITPEAQKATIQARSDTGN